MIFEPCTSSGEKTASAVISTHPGLLMAVDLIAPSVGTAVLKIYDNVSTSTGTILFECATTAGVASQSFSFNMARFVSHGIYASLVDAQGDASYVVGYTVGG